MNAMLSNIKEQLETQRARVQYFIRRYKMVNGPREYTLSQLWSWGRINAGELELATYGTLLPTTSGPPGVILAILTTPESSEEGSEIYQLSDDEFYGTDDQIMAMLHEQALKEYVQVKAISEQRAEAQRLELERRAERDREWAKKRQMDTVKEMFSKPMDKDALALCEALLAAHKPKPPEGTNGG